MPRTRRNLLPRGTSHTSNASVHSYRPVLQAGHETSSEQVLPVSQLRALLCGYRSKVCLNYRARKRDGSFHRFCEEHRQRANMNQKNWANRRFQAARDLELSHATPQLLPGYQQLLAIATGRHESTGWYPVSSDISDAATRTDRGGNHARRHTAQPALSAIRCDADEHWHSLGLTELDEGIAYAV